MDIDSLYQKAQEHLEQGQLAEAERLGDQLVRFRYSGGYEVLARVFVAKGEPERAITALKRGLQDTPKVWRLWLELASIQGRTGEFEDAVQAYAQARACPDAERDVIDFNEARLAHDRDRPRRAAKLLEDILERSEDKDTRLVALTELLKILAIRGRMGEVMMILGQEKLPYNEIADILPILPDTVMKAGNIFAATRLSETAKKAREAYKEQAESEAAGG